MSHNIRAAICYYKININMFCLSTYSVPMGLLLSSIVQGELTKMLQVVTETYICRHIYRQMIQSLNVVVGGCKYLFIFLFIFKATLIVFYLNIFSGCCSGLYMSIIDKSLILFYFVEHDGKFVKKVFYFPCGFKQEVCIEIHYNVFKIYATSPKQPQNSME